MTVLQVVKDLISADMSAHSFRQQAIDNRKTLIELRRMTCLPLEGVVNSYREGNQDFNQSNKKIDSLFFSFLCAMEDFREDKRFEDLWGAGDLWRQRVRNATEFMRKYLVLAAVCANWINPAKQFMHAWINFLNLPENTDFKREQIILISLCQKWVSHHLGEYSTNDIDGLNKILDEEAIKILKSLYSYGFYLQSHANATPVGERFLDCNKTRAGYFLFSQRINPGKKIKLTLNSSDIKSLGKNLIDLDVSNKAMHDKLTGSEAKLLMEISRRYTGCTLDLDGDFNFDTDILGRDSLNSKDFIFVMVCLKVFYKIQVSYFDVCEDANELSGFYDSLKNKVEGEECHIPSALRILLDFFYSDPRRNRHDPRRKLENLLKNHCKEVLGEEFIKRYFDGRIPNSFPLGKHFEVSGYQDGRKKSLYHYIAGGEFFKFQLMKVLNSSGELAIALKYLLDSFNAAHDIEDSFL